MYLCNFSKWSGYCRIVLFKFVNCIQKKRKDTIYDICPKYLVVIYTSKYLYDFNCEGCNLHTIVSIQVHVESAAS